MLWSSTQPRLVAAPLAVPALPLPPAELDSEAGLASSLSGPVQHGSLPFENPECAASAGCPRSGQCASPARQALIEVYLSRRSELRGVAAKIIARPEEVDDVLQDVYLRLASSTCASEVQNPFGYCCQVVRNMAVNYCRRRMVEANHLVTTADGEMPEVEGGRAAEVGIDERRLLERIEAALATLPPRTRRVFELYRLEGRTQRDIAQCLGVSATLVNFMLKDVMAALASCGDLLGA